MTLADRIVIMRDGYIEQVGTPDEVFRRPATRFVAGFIGSPPMNLVEATVEDGRLTLGGWRHIAAAQAASRAASAAGQQVVFGLRPDDIYPSRPRPAFGRGRRGPRRSSCTVTITEPLGNETLVFAEFAGRDWVARMLNPQAAPAGRSREA